MQKSVEEQRPTRCLMVNPFLVPGSDSGSGVEGDGGSRTGFVRVLNCGWICLHFGLSSEYCTLSILGIVLYSLSAALNTALGPVSSRSFGIHFSNFFLSAPRSRCLPLPSSV